MSPNGSLLGRVALAAISLVGVPALHVANRVGVAKTNRVVESVAALPVRLEKIVGPNYPTRVVGHANGSAQRVRLGQTSCIARSQFAYILLSWANLSPVIKTGAQVDLSVGGEAHAWIVVDGAPVGEDEAKLGSYCVVVREMLPGSPRIDEPVAKKRTRD